MEIIEAYGGHFEDKETGAQFRRIVAGLAWPGKRPGFFVVVTEDLKEDIALKLCKVKVIAETEDENIDGLLRKGFEYVQRYKVQEVLADTTHKPMMQLLYQFNKSLSKKKLRTLYLQPAPFVEDPKALEFYAHAIKNRTQQDKKSLYFGESSKLPGYLTELSPDETVKTSFSDYPAIAALGYAVTYLDMNQPFEGQLPKHKNIALSYAVK